MLFTKYSYWQTFLSKFKNLRSAKHLDTLNENLDLLRMLGIWLPSKYIQVNYILIIFYKTFLITKFFNLGTYEICTFHVLFFNNNMF